MENNWFQNPWATNQWMPGGAEFEKWAAPISNLDTSDKSAGNTEFSVTADDNRSFIEKQQVDIVVLSDGDTNLLNNAINAIEYRNGIGQPEKVKAIRATNLANLVYALETNEFKNLEIKNLFLIGHGLWDGDSSCVIGDETIDLENIEKHRKNLGKLGKLVSRAIVLLTCGSASNINGNRGNELIGKIAKYTGKNTYGSQSWVAIWRTSFGNFNDTHPGDYFDFYNQPNHCPPNLEATTDKIKLAKRAYYKARCRYWLRGCSDGSVESVFDLNYRKIL